MDEAFQDTGVEITSVGNRYLGGTLGVESFLERYICEKVLAWSSEIEQLTSFVRTQPQAAYVAFMHGLSRRWTYLTRVMPVKDSLLQPLENVIRQKFLPALTGQAPCNDQASAMSACSTAKTWWPWNSGPFNNGSDSAFCYCLPTID